MTNVLILGTGSFGRLVHDRISRSCSSTLMSARTSSDGDLTAAVSAADVLVLAIPLTAYEAVTARIKPALLNTTLLVDVCSVKVKAIEALHKLLPEHPNWLMTHPLFGPQSAANGTKGLDLIVCESTPSTNVVIEFCKTELELNIIKMSAEEHDKQMARAQALTFYISEVLQSLHIGEQELMTPSYKKLVSLSELSTYESNELLNLFQNDNPFAAEVRARFLQAAGELNDKYLE